MATLRDIRRRIRSVENTRKITRAMEMVAGAKLKQLEAAAARSRPYTEGLKGVLARVLAEHPGFRHPLFEDRPEKRHVALMLITSDTGLCGSYNSDLVTEAERFMEVEGRDRVKLLTVGTYGYEHFRRLGFRAHASFANFKSRVDAGRVGQILRAATGVFSGGEADEVVIISCYFRSAASWGVRRMRFLGLEMDTTSSGTHSYPSLLEPGMQKVFDELIPRTLEGILRQVLFEAFSAEQSARMMAMRNATDNANDMIKELTLTRNKVRQAQITKEIIEVISGAEGLKS